MINVEQLTQITHIINQSAEDSWLWVAKQIYEHKPSMCPEELRRIAKQNPHITPNQLVAWTDCTINDARKVIDDLEWD